VADGAYSVLEIRGKEGRFSPYLKKGLVDSLSLCSLLGWVIVLLLD
jgi:hypothetical protein